MEARSPERYRPKLGVSGSGEFYSSQWGGQTTSLGSVDLFFLGRFFFFRLEMREPAGASWVLATASAADLLSNNFFKRCLRTCRCLRVDCICA